MVIHYLDIVGAPGAGKTEAGLAHAIGASRHGRVLHISATERSAETMHERAALIAGSTGWLEPVAFVPAARLEQSLRQIFRTIVCDGLEAWSPLQHEKLREYVELVAQLCPEVFVVNVVDRVFYDAMCAASRPKAHPSVQAIEAWKVLRT